MINKGAFLDTLESASHDNSNFYSPKLKSAMALLNAASSSEISAFKPFNSYSTRAAPKGFRKKIFTNTTHEVSLSDDSKVNDSSQNIPLWEGEFNFRKQKESQKKLFKILSDKNRFFKHSSRSFYFYDKNSDQALDYEEVKQFVDNLTLNLQIPQLQDNLVSKIFQKYDKNGSGRLTLPQFQHMHWDLLKTIQRVFYSTSTTSVCRSALIRQTPLNDKRNIYDYYSFEKKIGSGSFGQVFLVRDLCSYSQRVCKVISLSESLVPIKQIQAEIIVMKKLDHPNIVKVLEIFQNEEYLYIIMELCEGGELMQFIKDTSGCGQILTEQYVVDIMRQLLYAVHYFHSKSVVHKDLKPENVLLQNCDPESPVKIIDFGLAELFSRQWESSQCPAGTCYYMAPEVFYRNVTLKCDIWSLGCIVFQLLTGELPFPGHTVESVQYRIFNCDPDYSLFSLRPISSSAIDFIRIMLNKNVTERPTALECLKHPWLTSFPPLDATLSSKNILNLKLFSQQPITKRVFLNMIAHQQEITGNQLLFINRVFMTLDRGKHGLLTKEDLGQALSRCNFSGHEIYDIVNALDIDQSGTISYTEFISGCCTLNSALSFGYIKLIFKRVDTAGTGKLTYQQLVDLLLQCCNASISSSSSHSHNDSLKEIQEIHKMVRDIDTKCDGYIDFQEFAEYLSSP